MTDRKELKRLAREAIRDTKPSPVWVTLVVIVILTVVQLLSLNLSGDLDAYLTMAKGFAAGDIAIAEPAVSISPLAWLLALSLNLMSMVVSMGYTLYTLRVSRRASPGFGDVFDAFAMFFRVIVLSFVQSILVSSVYAIPMSLLSTLIDPVSASMFCLPLIVPMFMLAYAYRLADYILLDNPSFAAIQCLGLSRLAMQGRKWDMFKLDLSFLGWLLLCVFPPVWLWVRPYMSVTIAGYYDAVMPGFMEWLKTQPIPRRPGDGGPGFRNPTGGTGRTPGDPLDGDLRDNPGGWSVPGGKRGETPDESSDENDNDDNGGDEA